MQFQLLEVGLLTMYLNSSLGKLREPNNQLGKPVNIFLLITRTDPGFTEGANWPISTSAPYVRRERLV